MSKLDELERLREAATPGPWFTSPILAAPGQITIRQIGSNRPIARFTENEVAASDDYGDGSTQDTAQFIAVLVNAAPALLRVARAALEVPEALNWLETKGPGEPIHPGVVQVLEDFYAALRELESK